MLFAKIYLDMERITAQTEHLQAKHVGTGHADTTKHEWMENQHRDTIASHLGNRTMVHYMALVEGKSVGRVKYELLQRMLDPCSRPKKEEDK